MFLKALDPLDLIFALEKSATVAEVCVCMAKLGYPNFCADSVRACAYVLKKRNIEVSLPRQSSLPDFDFESEYDRMRRSSSQPRPRETGSRSFGRLNDVMDMQFACEKSRYLPEVNFWLGKIGYEDFEMEEIRATVYALNELGIACKMPEELDADESEVEEEWES